ncbi:MAG: SIMPL domain-containing protein [Candidatus Paceibacterota bacterium]
MEKTLQESLKNALGVLTIVLLLLSLYIVVQIVTDIKQKRDFDTITVDASAEVFATPDIAEISFSVIKEDKELANAQEAVDVIVKIQ